MNYKSVRRNLRAACAICILVCIVTLSACSGDNGTHISNNEGSESVGATDTDRPIGQPSNDSEVVNEMIAAYQSVLLGEKNYYESTTNESLLINQVYDLGAVQTTEPQQFIIQDLNGDSFPEAVIQMDMNGIEDFGSLILHYEDEKVTGYFMWPRAFGDLKIDGTFSSSGGVFDHGYSRIDFSNFNAMADAPNNTIIRQICYCTQSEYCDENGKLIEKYYKDDIEITAEEFEREIEKQSVKEDAPWMNFTSDNINRSIALLQNPID